MCIGLCVVCVGVCVSAHAQWRLSCIENKLIYSSRILFKLLRISVLFCPWIKFKAYSLACLTVLRNKKNVHMTSKCKHRLIFVKCLEPWKFRTLNSKLLSFHSSWLLQCSGPCKGKSPKQASCPSPPGLLSSQYETASGPTRTQQWG